MKAVSKQTIEQAQAGDQEAFSALYKATYGRNYYVTLKMVKREADTEDILQDAYVKIFHNLKKFTYKGENSFASWTTKIVSNTALDFLRRKSPVLFSEMGDDDGEAVFDIEDTSVEARPDLSLDQKETSRIVQELLDELSDEQRICTIMYYVEQLSIAEIAEQCGCSEGTIKSRLRYARIKLQGQGERLEREGLHIKHIAPMAVLLLLLQQEMAQAAEKAAPDLKLGEILTENLQGNQIENIVDNAKQTTVSTVQRSINKTLLVLLVTGGVLIGVAGSYVVQSFNKGNGQKNNDSAITTTATPDVTVTPTGMLAEENRTLPTEIPEKLPTETPVGLPEETSEEENVGTPTTTPAKETDGVTERPSPKTTKKPTPKPTAKVTKKPTAKPAAKATKKPTPKPKVKVTGKPKKTASPKPTKKSSDNPDWDDDYVDWDE